MPTLPNRVGIAQARRALVVRIVYGFPYYNSPAIFYLFCKVPQVKNVDSLKKTSATVQGLKGALKPKFS